MAWNVRNTAEKPSRIGFHSDYAKKLAYCINTSKLVSGGLDQKIHIWDLDRESQLPTNSISL
jgi:WD40 repeat protein